jgi:predicted PurR-regulated permease PerM
VVSQEQDVSAPPASGAGTAPPSPPAPAGNPGVRGWIVTALFVLAVFYTLYLTRELTLPIVLALLLSFLLRPAVRALQRVHVPLFAASALVVLALIGGVGAAVYSLAEPASLWLQKSPQIMRDLERKLRPLKEKVQEVNKAAQQVEKITNVDQTARAPAVQVQGPSIRKLVLESARHLLEGAIVVFFLLYFLLAAGESLIDRLAGTMRTPQTQDNLATIVRRIEHNISRYLGSMTLICAVMGALTALLTWALGMPNPLLWGTLAGVLNFIPYIGPMVMLTVLTVVALLTFDSLHQALLVPAGYFALEALEGQLLTPLFLGRHLSLNPLMIFLGIIFWSWLWGPAGGLLAVPILMTFKVICEHVPQLASLRLLLGR